MIFAALKKISCFKLFVQAVLPGTLLCIGVSLLAYFLQVIEVHYWGRPWLESLVLAILLGTAIRTFWTPGQLWSKGIQFSAKTLLEIAVFLLGAGMSTTMILEAGFPLLVGIVVVVFVAISISYSIGRLFGLPHHMATLIACGNSICGNSAIAAVAPIIGAKSSDVAASIAFTAVLGVLVVLGLPFLAVACHMTSREFGIFAGLTVYAVPQVLAATTPVSIIATQIGMLVKLVRVLMLVPVVIVLSIITRRTQITATASLPKDTANSPVQRTSIKLRNLVPWFIIGFLLMIAARSVGLIPQAMISIMSQVSMWLTIISMAALGLGVDIKVVLKAGFKVTFVVIVSLLALGGLSWILIQILAAGA